MPTLQKWTICIVTVGLSFRIVNTLFILEVKEDQGDDDQKE